MALERHSRSQWSWPRKVKQEPKHFPELRSHLGRINLGNLDPPPPSENCSTGRLVRRGGNAITDKGKGGGEHGRKKGGWLAI